MSDEPITFLASFPAIQSAIRVGDDGMRIQLHIPESQMDKALWLIAMRDKPLKITVELASEDELTRKSEQFESKDFTLIDTIKNNNGA